MLSLADLVWARGGSWSGEGGDRARNSVVSEQPVTERSPADCYLNSNNSPSAYISTTPQSRMLRTPNDYFFAVRRLIHGEVGDWFQFARENDALVSHLERTSDLSQHMSELSREWNECVASVDVHDIVRPSGEPEWDEVYAQLDRLRTERKAALESWRSTRDRCLGEFCDEAGRDAARKLGELRVEYAKLDRKSDLYKHLKHECKYEYPELIEDSNKRTPSVRVLSNWVKVDDLLQRQLENVRKVINQPGYVPPEPSTVRSLIDRGGGLIRRGHPSGYEQLEERSIAVADAWEDGANARISPRSARRYAV